MHNLIQGCWYHHDGPFSAHHLEAICTGVSDSEQSVPRCLLKSTHHTDCTLVAIFLNFSSSSISKLLVFILNSLCWQYIVECWSMIINNFVMFSRFLSTQNVGIRGESWDGRADPVQGSARDLKELLPILQEGKAGPFLLQKYNKTKTEKLTKTDTNINTWKKHN